MTKKAVILVSGGLDSSTVLAMIDKAGFDIYALSFNYGQNNLVELNHIKKTIKQYNVKSHHIINLDLSGFDISALISNAINIPKYKNVDDVKKGVPVTYVPARNTIFLSYALGYAEVIGAFDIFIGAHISDADHYPDCRVEYLSSYEKMANLATKNGVEGKNIRITAPLIKMSKSQVVTTGLKLGVNYANTISCYNPVDSKSCGECLSCVIRLQAFSDNNIEDPALYV